MSIDIIDIINIEDIANGLPFPAKRVKGFWRLFSVACTIAGARGGRKKCKCFHLRVGKVSGAPNKSDFFAGSCIQARRTRNLLGGDAKQLHGDVIGAATL